MVKNFAATQIPMNNATKYKIGLTLIEDAPMVNVTPRSMPNNRSTTLALTIDNPITKNRIRSVFFFALGASSASVVSEVKLISSGRIEE